MDILYHKNFSLQQIITSTVKLTEDDNSPYYDIDKAMREHTERGFNCIRIDSGTGLNEIFKLLTAS